LAVGYAFIDNIGIRGVMVLMFIGLVIYPWIRNRRKRKLRRFVKKVRKGRQVQAILVHDDRITVVVNGADGRFYTRMNGHLERLNSQLLHGQPFEIVVRDNLSDQHLSSLLREPGVVYVRRDILPSSSVSEG
jgi:hypothetical protein